VTSALVAAIMNVVWPASMSVRHPVYAASVMAVADPPMIRSWLV
jgi:hypothetical protein